MFQLLTSMLYGHEGSDSRSDRLTNGNSCLYPWPAGYYGPSDLAGRYMNLHVCTVHQ
jgi:hypothetical protein